MNMLYPNASYNEVCYKGTVLGVNNLTGAELRRFHCLTLYLIDAF